MSAEKGCLLSSSILHLGRKPDKASPCFVSGGETLKEYLRPFAEGSVVCLFRPLRQLLSVLLVGGIIVFGLKYSYGSRQEAWFSLHVNCIYWLFTAVGAMCLAAVFELSGANWFRPVRRLLEGAVLYLAIAPMILVLLGFGAKDLFPWFCHIAGRPWNEARWVYFRDVLFLVIFFYAAWKFTMLGLQRDVIAARSGAFGKRAASGRWTMREYCFLGREEGRSAIGEIGRLSSNIKRAASVVVFLYLLVSFLLVLDQLASVHPLWRSGLLGGLVFVSGALGALCWSAVLVALVLCLEPNYRRCITASTLDDLGKMIFALGVLWAYLSWNQFVFFDYSRVPKEMIWAVLGFSTQPWDAVAWTILGCCLLGPVLLGLVDRVRRTPGMLAATAFVTALGLWLEYYLFFAPILSPDRLPFAFSGIAVSLGFFALYTLFVFAFLARVPLIPFGDLCSLPGRTEY